MGNVRIFERFNIFKLDAVISLIYFISKQHNKCKFALGFIQLKPHSQFISITSCIKMPTLSTLYYGKTRLLQNLFQVRIEIVSTNRQKLFPPFDWNYCAMIQGHTRDMSHSDYISKQKFTDCNELEFLIHCGGWRPLIVVNIYVTVSN